jgi:hypothetical protein
MKKSIIDKAHDRIWRVVTERLTARMPLPADNKTLDDNSSVSAAMEWPLACTALVSGAWTTRNFRKTHAVRQVVETLGPFDGKHFAQWILDHAPEYLMDDRVIAVDTWGNPIRWPACLLRTPRAFSPTTLRYLAHALWLKKEGFVKEGGTIIEIGVGYGGLAAMNALVSKATTIMVDLDPVAKTAMRCMKELGLGEYATTDYRKATEGKACFVSNYAFTELSRELQDAYASEWIRHTDCGVILSNAAVFLDHMQSRDNKEIIEMLSTHGLAARVETNDRILCKSDHQHGNALVTWK